MFADFDFNGLVCAGLILAIILIYTAVYLVERVLETIEELNRKKK